MRLFEIKWNQLVDNAVRASQKNLTTKLYVHYSKSPQITINPNPKHMDTVGIYLFPEEFSAIEHWTNYLYKLYVKFKPNTSILDLSTLSNKQIDTILSKVPEAKEEYKATLAEYPKNAMHEKVDLMWEMLQRHFSLRLGRKQAAFNKLFRSLGYQAIFDDTKSVHVSEIQMIRNFLFFVFLIFSATFHHLA